MRVQVLYTDSSGTYRVRADVKENNRSIHILDIVDDEYGTEADVDDFTDEEQATIHNLILEEYDALDRDNGEEYDDDEDDGDELPEDY